MDYITIGKITKTLGLKGEVKIYPCSDFRQDRYEKGNKLYLYDVSKEERTPVEVLTYRYDNVVDIVAFKNLQNIDLVEPFLNCLVQIEKNVDELPKGFYFLSDLQNCLVVDEKGEKIGIVAKVEEYASYRTLRIKRVDQKDILVPFVEAFIINVDIVLKRIVIKVWDGLL